METRHIKRQLILAALFAALLVVAVAGWTVQGGRRLVPAT
jgi:ABC-type transporter Mla subunit MlaD